MKKLLKLLAVPIFTLGVGLAPTLPVSAAPIDSAYEACGTSNSPVCANVDDAQVNTLVQTIINILLYVLGIIAVIMIIVGGIRYTTSNGDASSLTSAKNTILYSVVGLVVALMAWTIVNFVIGRF